MIIYDMKTEDLINPIGIDEKKPRYSWKLQSKISGTVQTAYRIIVRSDNDTVWDSGKVMSDRSICIEYNGRSLSAMTKYSWQVSVWDEQGNEYTSDTADFETGLMNNEFNSDWIGSPQETVNTYAVDNYKISCTFKSDNLGLVANARNKDNYVLFNICKDSVSVYEISDNAWNDNVPYKKLLGTFHVTEHSDSLELSVNKTNVLLYLNGQKVIDEDILPKKPQDAQRVLGEPLAGHTHRPYDAALQVGLPAKGVHKAFLFIVGHGVDGKIPPGQILPHIRH